MRHRRRVRPHLPPQDAHSSAPNAAVCRCASCSLVHAENLLREIRALELEIIRLEKRRRADWRAAIREALLGEDT